MKALVPAAVLALVLACSSHAHAPGLRPGPSQNLIEAVATSDLEETGASTPYHLKLDLPISGDVAVVFGDLYRALERRGVSAVVLEIDSPGGSVNAGFSMTKAIEEAPFPTICVVDGDAASMAFYLLQSCSIRMMTDRSVLMAHEPSATAVVGGQQEEWLRTGKNLSSALKALSKAMNRHMARRLRISYEELTKKLENGGEWWLDSDEAMAVGAVDVVVESMDEAADIIDGAL